MTEVLSGIAGQGQRTPQLVVHWVMLFPSGEPASAVLQESDHAKAHEWARQWLADWRVVDADAQGDQVTLHRRIVTVGPWRPADIVVPIQVGELDD